jgi:hypothetical protein
MSRNTSSPLNIRKIIKQQAEKVIDKMGDNIFVKSTAYAKRIVEMQTDLGTMENAKKAMVDNNGPKIINLSDDGRIITPNPNHLTLVNNETQAGNLKCGAKIEDIIAERAQLKEEMIELDSYETDLDKVLAEKKLASQNKFEALMRDQPRSKS